MSTAKISAAGMGMLANAEGYDLEWLNGALLGAAMGAMFIVGACVVGTIPVMVTLGSSGITAMLSFMTPALPLTMAAFAMIGAFEFGTN